MFEEGVHESEVSDDVSSAVVMPEKVDVPFTSEEKVLYQYFSTVQSKIPPKFLANDFFYSFLRDQGHNGHKDQRQ